METYIKVLHGNQIGGCVVIICCRHTKICIDFGENLPGYEGNRLEIDWEAEGIDAVFFTHYHGDHIGRFMEIPLGIPLYMGSTARKIMLNIQKALQDEEKVRILSDGNRIHEMEVGKPVLIGEIRVTPYMVDHSAYDAFMFLVETSDKKILYTGDFRNHGYRGKALLPMLRKYITRYGKRRIDILITEGTSMGRQEESVFSETGMLEAAKKIFAKHKYVFLICSSTNLDSLASFYHAAVSYGMGMYANHYVYSQLKTFRETAGAITDFYYFKYIYEIRFRFQLPRSKQTQEEHMREKGFVTVIKAEEAYEGWIERFSDLNPVVIYSMWEGYLDPDQKAYKKDLHAFVEKYHAIHLHTSGHAPASLIEEVIREINPAEEIIPIHTEWAEGFQKLNLKQELKDRVRVQE